MQNTSIKNILVVLVLTVSIAILTVIVFFAKNSSQHQDTITTFTDCTNAPGSVVMESFPLQCRTKDGRVFAQENVPRDAIIEPPYNGGDTGKDPSQPGIMPIPDENIPGGVGGENPQYQSDTVPKI